MKKRIMTLMMVLLLSISNLSACGGNKSISSNNSDEDKTEESEQEINESESRAFKVETEELNAENVTEIFDTLNELEYQPLLTEQTEDDIEDNAVQDGEMDADNLPIYWGTPDGPEIAVKDYYANTVFELVSYEIIKSTKVYAFFTITSKKDGILVEPDRSIELRYEDGKWKVINEGYGWISENNKLLKK